MCPTLFLLICANVFLVGDGNVWIQGGGLGGRVLRLEKARGTSAAARSEKDREQSAAAKEGGGRYPILGKSH